MAGPGQVVLPDMAKTIYLVLERLEVGQLLDGLEIREEAWRNTARFLESGAVDEDFFVPEECNGPEEASNIADDYRAIIERIRKQLAAQRSGGAEGDRLVPPKEGVVSGYAIYIDTFCQGKVAVERDENNKPVVYATKRGAEREIVESAMIRMNQFLAVEREFEDAITVEEFVVAVELYSDGSIRDEDGRVFPNEGW